MENKTLRSKLFSFFSRKNRSLPSNTETIAFGGKPWSFDDGGKVDNSTYQSCINCLANHISLIKPRCYIGGKPNDNKRWLDRIIGLRPNPVNNASDFYYTLASDYFAYGLAIAHLEYDDDGYLACILPVDQQSIQIKKSGSGLYLTCSCGDGKEVTDSLDGFLILIRKANSRNPLLPMDSSLDRIIKVLNTNGESFAAAMIESHFVRYVCKLASVSKEETKEKIRQSFNKQLEESKNGLLITDGVVDFKELNAGSAVYAHQPELDNFEGEIYSHFGVTKEFVQGKYSPNEYDAVYRSSIQPFIKRLSEEVTYKIFTLKEQGYGNEIRIETSQLDTASLDSRIKVAQTIIQGATYTANELRRLLFMPEIEGGDKVIQSLNYVNADKADNYQGVGSDNTNDKEEKPKGGTDDANE